MGTITAIPPGASPEIPRRRPARLCRVVLCFLLSVSSVALGQEISTILFLDYQFGVPTDIERSAGEISYCATCDGTGRSQSHTARTGIRVDLPGVQLFGLPTYLGASLHVTTGAFRSNSYTVGRSVDTGVVTTEEEFTLRSLTAGLGVEGGIVVALGRLRGSAGLWSNLRVAGYLLQQEEILYPTGMTYEGVGTTRRIVRENEELSDEPVGYGLQIGLGLPIDLGRRLRLLPTLGTRIDLPGLFDGIGLRSFSAFVRLGIDLERPPERPSPPLPPATMTLAPPPAPPVPAPITIALEVRAESEGVRTDTARIVLRRELRRLHRTGEITEEISEYYEAPEIRVAPTMRSPAGIAWWGLTFRRDGREIARVTSDNPRGALDLDLTPREGGDPGAPLQGELVAEDSAGRAGVARTILPVIIDSSIVGRPGTYSQVTDVWEISREVSEDMLEEIDSLLTESRVISIDVSCEGDPRVCRHAQDLHDRFALRYPDRTTMTRDGDGGPLVLRIVRR